MSTPPPPPRIEIHRPAPGRGYYAIYHGAELMGQRFESQQAPALWAGILQRATDLVRRAGGEVDDRQVSPALDRAKAGSETRIKALSFATPEGGNTTLQGGYRAQAYSGD